MEQQTQYATTLLMTTAGAVLAAVYDIYRSSLKEWRFLGRFAALLDFLFWIFALMFVFTLLLGVNDGDVRVVVFVLLGIGALIYWKTAHPLVEASTRMIVRFIYRVLVTVQRIFSAVFIRPLRYLLKIARKLIILLDNSLLKMEPVISWPIVKISDSSEAGARFVAKNYVLPVMRRGKEHVRAMSNRYRKKMSGWLRRDAKDDDRET